MEKYIRNQNKKQLENSKRWLSRAYKIDLQISSKEEQIVTLYNRATSNISNYAPSVGKNNNYNCKVENYCIKMCDMELELEQDKQHLIVIKQEITSAIDKIEEAKLRIVLEQRYLLGKSWRDISKNMGYIEQYVKQKLHIRAIEEIAKIID